jgi:plastocyanin
MTRRSPFALPFIAIGLAVASGCGGMMNNSNPGAVSANSAPDLITISGMAFTPAHLQVTPGATVTVRNMDSMAHSVTSEAAMNAFRPGAMAGVSFDTGPFMGEMTFTIPMTAAVGTVIPFFSTTDTSMMMTPNGEIEIVAPTSTPMPMPMSMPSPM